MLTTVLCVFRYALPKFWRSSIDKYAAAEILQVRVE